MCRIVQNTEASAFIFWYHDNRMINYDSDRGINVSTEAGKSPIFFFIYISLSFYIESFAQKTKLNKEEKKRKRQHSETHYTRTYVYIEMRCCRKLYYTFIEIDELPGFSWRANVFGIS